MFFTCKPIRVTKIGFTRKSYYGNGRFTHNEMGGSFENACQLA